VGEGGRVQEEADVFRARIGEMAVGSSTRIHMGEIGRRQILRRRFRRRKAWHGFRTFVDLFPFTHLHAPLDRSALSGRANLTSHGDSIR